MGFEQLPVSVTVNTVLCYRVAREDANPLYLGVSYAWNIQLCSVQHSQDRSTQQCGRPRTLTKAIAETPVSLITMIANVVRMCDESSNVQVCCPVTTTPSGCSYERKLCRSKAWRTNTQAKTQFLLLRWRAKFEPHQTQHLSGRPQAHFCTPKTLSGLLYSFTCIGALAIWEKPDPLNLLPKTLEPLERIHPNFRKRCIVKRTSINS